MSHTDVHLLKLLKINGTLHGSGLVFGSSIGFLGVFQFLELQVDDTVLNLLKQQGGLAELVSGLQQVGGTKLVPVEGVQTYHLAQLVAAERQERLEGYCEVGAKLE